MSSALDARDTAAPASPQSAPPRASGRVRLWAVLGLVLVTVSTTTWSRWIVSDHIGTVETGADDYDWMWVLRAATEVVSSGVFVLLLWYTLLRPAIGNAGSPSTASCSSVASSPRASTCSARPTTRPGR